ncbi:hypothetical protein D3C73_1619900 [compost metagenome]
MHMLGPNFDQHVLKSFFDLSVITLVFQRKGHAVKDTVQHIKSITRLLLRIN